MSSGPASWKKGRAQVQGDGQGLPIADAGGEGLSPC